MAQDEKTQARTREYTDTNPIEMFPGVVRRTLVSGDNLTLLQITLSPGAEVPQHTHPHEQAGTVADGKIHIEIGDQSWELGPGASYLIPGDAPHYVRAIDAATLIEVFSPVREEFAND
jgi:quercetin dioxygenase-like cupin family protein